MCGGNGATKKISYHFKQNVKCIIYVHKLIKKGVKKYFMVTCITVTYISRFRCQCCFYRTNKRKSNFLFHLFLHTVEFWNHKQRIHSNNHLHELNT